MTIIHTPDQINLYRMKTLRSALELEIKGMKRRGSSAYSIIKKEWKLTGNKGKVLEKFKDCIKAAEFDTNSFKDTVIN